MVKGQKTGIIICALLGVSFLLVIANLYCLLKVVPKYLRLYASMGCTLPLATRTYISASYFFRRWFFLLLPVLVVSFVIYMVLPLAIKNKTIIIKIYSIIVGLLLASILLLNLAIRLPTINMSLGPGMHSFRHSTTIELLNIDPLINHVVNVYDVAGRLVTKLPHSNGNTTWTANNHPARLCLLKLNPDTDSPSTNLLKLQ